MIDIDQAFQQVWDFRRKEDNEGDSMSEDSRPSSGLTPFLSSPEKDDQETTQKIGNPSRNKTNRKLTQNRPAKRKSIPDYDPDLLLSDFKKFTDTLIEEIKVSRKKMLSQMKRQITMIAKTKHSQAPKRSRKAVPKSDTKPMHLETGKKPRRATQTQTKRKRSNAKVQDTKKCSSNLLNNPETRTNSFNADQKQQNSLADASNPLEESCLSKEMCTGTKGDFDITELFKRDNGSKDLALMESQTSSILQHWYNSNISGQPIMSESFEARSDMMSYDSNNGGRFVSFGSGDAKAELYKQNIL